MGKPSQSSLKEFSDNFFRITGRSDKKQFLTYYFIAAHPGCNEQDMMELKKFTSGELNINPEQVQIYTPTPSTWSSVMYYTGLNPFEKKNGAYTPLYVEENVSGKTRQKDILTVKKRY
jgi:radical SAM superfamily enzyme YgiQ (UPF0313 family)